MRRVVFRSFEWLGVTPFELTPRKIEYRTNPCSKQISEPRNEGLVDGTRPAGQSPSRIVDAEHPWRPKPVRVTM